MALGVDVAETVHKVVSSANECVEKIDLFVSNPQPRYNISIEFLMSIRSALANNSTLTASLFEDSCDMLERIAAHYVECHDGSTEGF